MSDIILDRQHVNMDALDATLRAALGTAISGISFAKRKVAIHFVSEPTAEQDAQARSIVQAHDATALSPGQQAVRDRNAAVAEAKPGAQAARQAAQAAHADVKDNWGNLSAPQKQDAMRQLLLANYAMLRYLIALLPAD